MSNRNKWAHRSKPKENLSVQYFLGVALVALGGFAFWSGIEGLRNHIMWFKTFSARSGSFVGVPTASLLLLGGVFFLAGAILLIVLIVRK